MQVFCCPQFVYIANSSVKTAQAKHSCATFNPAKLGSNSREDIGYCRHRSPQAAAGWEVGDRYLKSQAVCSL